MSKVEVDRWKTDLIAGGFAPKRYGSYVRMVRRLLWPFIRPFHFYTLEVMGEQQELWESGSRALISHMAEMEKGFERALLHSSNLKSEFHRQFATLISEQSRVRSDMAALINRQLSTEDEHASLTARIDDHGTKFSRVTEQVARLEASLGDLANCMQGKLAPRTTLFFSPTDHGLMLLKTGDYLSEVTAKAGASDEHISGVVSQTAADRPSGMALDIGAHIGMITVPLARRFGRVVSFEPNRVNYAILTANVALNRLSNVECRNVACFSRATRLSLADQTQQEIPIPLDDAQRFDWISANNLGAFVFNEHGTGIFETEAITVDSLCLENVAFCKIDAQGADGEVLKGANETIKTSQPVIVFEWEEELSRHFSVTLDDIRGMLANLGYRIDVLKQHNHKQVDFIARPRQM